MHSEPRLEARLYRGQEADLRVFPSHLTALTSHFSFLISHFSFLISHFSFLTRHADCFYQFEENGLALCGGEPCGRTLDDGSCRRRLQGPFLFLGLIVEKGCFLGGERLLMICIDYILKSHG